MYIPKPYAETRPEAIERIVARIGFGMLITGSDESRLVTHLPFIFSPDEGPHGTLRAHLARANGHSKQLENSPAMVVFQGPHAYVSPTWSAGAMQVPTWNYVAVHAHGRVTVMTAEELRASLGALVAHFEAKYGSSWSIDALSPSSLTSHLAAIVGITIRLDRLEAKQKLSQNIPVEARRSLLAVLSSHASLGVREMADWMATTAGVLSETESASKRPDLP